VERLQIILKDDGKPSELGTPGPARGRMIVASQAEPRRATMRRNKINRSKPIQIAAPIRIGGIAPGGLK
jgi:hypothetical protein